jgi:hypothetical protein
MAQALVTLDNEVPVYLATGVQLRRRAVRWPIALCAIVAVVSGAFAFVESPLSRRVGVDRDRVVRCARHLQCMQPENL